MKQHTKLSMLESFVCYFIFFILNSPINIHLIVRNSRRLTAASEKVDQVVRALRDRSRVLSEDACEGDAILVAKVQNWTTSSG